MAKKLTGAEIDRLFGDDGSGQSAAPAATPAAPLTGAQINDAFGDAATPATTAAPSNPQPGGWGDTISDALGYGRGLLGSFQHGLTFGLDRPINAISAGLLGNTSVGQKLAADIAAQKTFEAQNPIASTIAETAGSIPTYGAGERLLASTVLPAVRGTGIANTAINAATSAGRNALLGGAQAAGMTDGDLNARIDAARQGALIGGVAGPVADRIGNTVTGRLGGLDPEKAALAAQARDQYGIPVRAPQLSGSSMVRIAADQAANVPFSGQAAADAAQRGAFNRAVGRTFGENADRITPDVMTHAATRIGHDFDTVAARTNITADPQFINDLATIETDAGRLTPDQATTIRGHITDVMHAAAQGNGVIPGDVYQSLTRANAPLGRATRDQNSNIAYYGQAIRDALDDAFQRSASPADQALLTQARTQYRAMRTVEDLVEKAPTGDISPALLMGQVRSASNRFNPGTSGMAYTGGGPLGDLARIGQAFLKPQPNSGTADRALVNHLLTGGALFGAGAGALLNPQTLIGVPAGWAALRGLNEVARSNVLANNMINSTVNPGSIPLSTYGRYAVPLANALSSGKVPVQ